jgi:hypothetical protein
MCTHNYEHMIGHDVCMSCSLPDHTCTIVVYAYKWCSWCEVEMPFCKEDRTWGCVIIAWNTMSCVPTHRWCHQSLAYDGEYRTWMPKSPIVLCVFIIFLDFVYFNALMYCATRVRIFVFFWLVIYAYLPRIQSSCISCCCCSWGILLQDATKHPANVVSRVNWVYPPI